MEKTKLAENQIVIPCTQEPPFSMGDRLYKVEFPCNGHISHKQTFSPMCPCCGNNRKVVVKGVDGQSYDAPCPHCINNRYTSTFDNQLTLNNWVVHEYIVNGIDVRFKPIKTLFTKEGISNSYRADPIEHIRITAFHRFGRCEVQ